MRERSRFERILLAAALSLPLAVASRAAAAEPVVLKAVTGWPKSSSEVKAFQIFLETVDEMVARSAPGELRIQYIGGPEAVKINDQVQAAQRGMVDMVYTTTAYYLSVIPDVDALKLSELTPAEERKSGAWALLNRIHEQKGLHYLARLGLGEPFHLYLKKPVQSADLKGLSIRVSPMYLQIIKGLGGTPVVIPPTEVYQALERNVVDGLCWPAVGIRDWAWDKQVKYVVEPGFYEVPNPLLVNLDAWKKLSQKHRDLLGAAAAEAEKKVVAHFAGLAREERPILLQEGIQVIDLPPAERQKLLRIGSEEGWKAVLERSPQTGPELRKLLTRK